MEKLTFNQYFYEHYNRVRDLFINQIARQVFPKGDEQRFTHYSGVDLIDTNLGVTELAWDISFNITWKMYDEMHKLL